MNLNPFYYAKSNEHILYYFYNNTESSHKIYLNDKLVGEYNKTIGSYTITVDNFEFILNSKLTKLTTSFKFDDKELEVKKVSKKQIRKILTSRNIFNEVNPTKKEIENLRFKISDLYLPILLIFVAVGIQYFTYDKSLFYKIIPGIPCFWAGIMLKNILVTHVKFLEPIRKLGIAFVFVVFAFVEFISNLLYEI